MSRSWCQDRLSDLKSNLCVWGQVLLEEAQTRFDIAPPWDPQGIHAKVLWAARRTPVWQIEAPFLEPQALEHRFLNPRAWGG